MINYDYNLELHIKNLRLAKYVVHRRYGKYKLHKDDLIQLCLIRLCLAYPSFDPSKGKYSTWAVIVCCRVIQCYLRSKDFRNHWENMSLDFSFDDSNLTLLDCDMLGTTDEYGADVDYLVHQIYTIAKVKYKSSGKLKSPLLEKIVEFLSEGFTQAEIADKLGFTRQYISQQIKELRIRLQDKLIADGFIEKQLTE